MIKNSDIRFHQKTKFNPKAKTLNEFVDVENQPQYSPPILDSWSNEELLELITDPDRLDLRGIPIDTQVVERTIRDVS